MTDKNKTIKVRATSANVELNISTPDTKQIISATNNRAQYYAEQAKKFRDEAKYFSEQNSDVTYEYINNFKAEFDLKLSNKQNIGDYAMRNDIPEKVSELVNDANYVNRNELDVEIENVKLPSQEGCEGKVLLSDGVNERWSGINTFELFDMKYTDYLLEGRETLGWALQGTYVYKEALAGSRYGYPDFYAKCLEEYTVATSIETINGVEVKVHSNGHKFYNIADKTAIDNFFNTMGSAWFYGVDTENERIFLPRNNYFEQVTCNISEVGQSAEAGLPNIVGSITYHPLHTSSVLNGAFISGAKRTTGTGSTGEARDMTFDASLSNPIYGKSATVQPNAVKKLLYICVGNTTNYEGITDVVSQGMEILEQVSQKVNIDGTNFNSEGKSLVAGYGMPSNRHINLTLGASGTEYTAPANGWVYFEGRQTSAGGYIQLNNISSNFATGAQTSYNDNWHRIYIPVKKGEKFAALYTNVNNTVLRFIYAEGEVI